MAAEIAFEELSKNPGPYRVLDPMVGSGTTAAVAVRLGHKAIGFDTDPLAVLMTKVWCSRVRSRAIMEMGDLVLSRAKRLNKKIKLSSCYPHGCEDQETRAFIRYWFDPINRKQLFSLSSVIGNIEDDDRRGVLWCAFSRMIIKKAGGVSLGMDVSHSRPHKTHQFARERAFDIFRCSLSRVLDALEESGPIRGTPKVAEGDARDLPLHDQSIDIAITSPPYLNAIDYLRGHRLSLVWMGNSIPYLRSIRAKNIGSELSGTKEDLARSSDLIGKMCDKKNISWNLKSILSKYVADLDRTIKEICRVLSPKGRAVFVIGNSTTQGVYVKNSVAIRELGEQNGLELIGSRMRRLPANRRYLPPPSKSTGNISNRIRTEVMLSFKKYS
jgi:DNA modification methylase